VAVRTTTCPCTAPAKDKATNASRGEAGTASARELQQSVSEMPHMVGKRVEGTERRRPENMPRQPPGIPPHYTFRLPHQAQSPPSVQQRVDEAEQEAASRAAVSRVTRRASGEVTPVRASRSLMNKSAHARSFVGAGVRYASAAVTAMCRIRYSRNAAGSRYR